MTAVSGVIVLLFGWSAWTGFELWEGKPRAFRSAMLIFAAQIVSFTVPGFAFAGFFTGLRAYFAISQRAPFLRFGLDLVSALIAKNRRKWKPKPLNHRGHGEHGGRSGMEDGGIGTSEDRSKPEEIARSAKIAKNRRS
jgi:hypothetical protein